jgi:hypothetical protein
MTKEHPILFSAPMVRAILEGRKTQTRRIIKRQPNIDPQTGDWLLTNSDGSETAEPIERWVDMQIKLHCPFGKVGDHLWVRETWRPKVHSFQIGHLYEYRATAEHNLTPTDGAWKPSIFMPRSACRVELEITDIRVERLNEISESDAIEEGVEFCEEIGYKLYSKKNFFSKNISASDSYRSLWQLINGVDSWEKNPFVWVISFRRV